MSFMNMQFDLPWQIETFHSCPQLGPWFLSPGDRRFTRKIYIRKLSLKSPNCSTTCIGMEPLWSFLNHFFFLRVFFLCGALMKSYVWFSRQEVSLSLLRDSKVQEGFPQDLLPQSQGLDSLWNWWYAARKWTWHSRLVTVNLESLNANDIRYIEWYLMSIQNSYNVYIYIYIIYVFL